MSVHLTRIYTRTGDDGTTGLSDFSRVPKDDSRLIAYATCEEANAALGQALSFGTLDDEVSTVIRYVQNDLFDAGADLATPIEENPKYPPLRIEPDYIERLEHWCDQFNEQLPKLDSFILPGGTPAAALLHTARVITRRAERAAWAACREFRGWPMTATTSSGFPVANAKMSAKRPWMRKSAALASQVC